jgi:hypothetical protein
MNSIYIFLFLRRIYNKRNNNYLTLTRGYKKKTPWSESARETIPTEQPPFVGEVIANFCG